MIDFIIVGRGLAATALMHEFSEKNISFCVIGKTDLSRCSQVAAGIWNPVVFKRLTKSWMADELIACLLQFYSDCEKRTNVSFITIREIIRSFNEEQEKNLWLKKSRNELDQFLDQEIFPPSSAPGGCKIKTEFSKVRNAGNLDVAKFLNASEKLFEDKIINQEFIHQKLITGEHIQYDNILAANIIFCEGYLLKNNPFFNWVPLKPAKGEILTAEIKELGLGNTIFNRSVFLMQTEINSYKTGATYNWEHLNDNPTDEGKREITEKLSGMISNFKVLKHEAGVRPSSPDRRPIVGPHPVYKNLYLFNGLGTKGVMLAPYFIKNFVNFYLQNEAIKPEVSIKRFYHLYEEKK